jgi:hypothetical protein
VVAVDRGVLRADALQHAQPANEIRGQAGGRRRAVLLGGGAP